MCASFDMYSINEENELANKIANLLQTLKFILSRHPPHKYNNESSHTILLLCLSQQVSIAVKVSAFPFPLYIFIRFQIMS